MTAGVSSPERRARAFRIQTRYHPELFRLNLADARLREPRTETGLIRCQRPAIDVKGSAP
jgi:hypothetical protein